MFVLIAFWSSCGSLCFVHVSFKPLTLFYLHPGPSVLCVHVFILFSFLQLGLGFYFYCTEVPPCVLVFVFFFLALRLSPQVLLICKMVLPFVLQMVWFLFWPLF